jgi:hypothetical protein
MSDREDRTMKSLITVLIVAPLALGAGCGDNKHRPDASVHKDASFDALIFARAPELGAQIDRMGRPAINTALIATVEPTVTAPAMKEAYDTAPTPATWANHVLKAGAPDQTIKLELAKNLALFDALDANSGAVGAGCGNQALYNSPAASGYANLAALLADDQLYVDTSKSTCTSYLSLEVEVATSGAIVHTHCGGRTLSHDVIDTTYSLLAAGLAGFSTDGNLTPLIHDGLVGPHTDISAGFPFLGPPH